MSWNKKDWFPPVMCYWTSVCLLLEQQWSFVNTEMLQGKYHVTEATHIRNKGGSIVTQNLYKYAKHKQTPVY